MIIIPILIIALVIFAIVSAIRAKIYDNRENRQIAERYDVIDSLYLGMPETQMLSVMRQTLQGNDYTKSLLSDNRVAYKWIYEDAEYIRNIDFGVSWSNPGARGLDIYCKDGMVEEIRPYNL